MRAATAALKVWFIPQRRAEIGEISTRARASCPFWTLGRLDGPDGVGLALEKLQRVALHTRERRAENANVADNHHIHLPEVAA
jgi:hypothetical protein